MFASTYKRFWFCIESICLWEILNLFLPRWICVYPAYINSKKTIKEGRRIAKDKVRIILLFILINVCIYTHTHMRRCLIKKLILSDKRKNSDDKLFGKREDWSNLNTFFFSPTRFVVMLINEGKNEWSLEFGYKQERLVCVLFKIISRNNIEKIWCY